MKRLYQKIKKTPMLIVFLIILIFFTPFYILSPGENRNKAIVTAIGIDKGEQAEFEVSLLTFIPTANPTYLETNSVVSASGDTIAKALYQAQILIGKKIGLSHARTTVVGEAVLQEDIAPSVDYLSRIASLSENTVFISTNGKAKDFLLASQTLGEDIGLKLDQLISYDVKKVYVTETTLESFYEGYFSPVKTSIIGYLQLVDESESNIASMDSSQSGESGSSGGSSGEGNSSGGGSGGSGSGQGGSSEKKKIVNNGDVLLLKNGKKVQVLSEEILQGINVVNKRAIGQIIRIENVEDGEFDGSDLSYAVRKKDVKNNLKMENGRPIMSYTIDLGLELIEIDGKKDDLKVNSEYTLLTDQISMLIEEKLKKQFTKSLNLLRENKTDVLGLTLLMQTSGGEFKRFYNSLDEKDDILNHINFQISVRCKSE